MTKDGDGGGQEVISLGSSTSTENAVLMGFPIAIISPLQVPTAEMAIKTQDEEDLDVTHMGIEHGGETELGHVVPVIQNCDNLIRANHATLQSLLSTPISGSQVFHHPDSIQVIALPNTSDIIGLAGDSGGRIIQLVPGDIGSQMSKYISIAAIANPNIVSTGKADITGLSNVEIVQNTESSDLTSGSDAMAAILMPPPMPVQDLPPGCPSWAMRLKRCEKIGDSYRGYVENEADLDLILTLHKQQTNSFWGTRQSPSPAKASTRLMWKSQYVPFDGIPFINAGSRAVVMECQFGPRRKGTLGKRGTTPSSTGEFKQTCPARIYIKKVRKFPAHAVDLTLDKKNIRLAMDKAFHELKEQGLDSWGEERYYVQLPTEKAHDYHDEECRKIDSNPATPSTITTIEETQQQIQQPQVVSRPERSAEARIHPSVLEKIRQMVAMGETRLYTIRKQLRKFVVREMFQGSGQVPERHDLTMFPTVNDLKNHIHQALKDIESGVLPLIAPLVDMSLPEESNCDTDTMSSREIKTELSSMWSGANVPSSSPMPESVTVTLTQSPGEDGHHFISRIETHLSDGTTQVSTTLTPETAHLLARLHPGLFTTGKLQQADSSPSQGEGVEGESSTDLEVNDTTENPTSGLDTASMVDGVHVIGGLDPSHLSSIVGMDLSHNISAMMEEDSVPSQTMSGIHLDTGSAHSMAGLMDTDSANFASIVSSESHSISTLHMTGAGLSLSDASDAHHLIVPSHSDTMVQFTSDTDPHSGHLTLVSADGLDGHEALMKAGSLSEDGQSDKLTEDKITLHLTSDQELGMVRLENKVSDL